jgi:hypothetical protein
VAKVQGGGALKVRHTGSRKGGHERRTQAK